MWGIGLLLGSWPNVSPSWPPAVLKSVPGVHEARLPNRKEFLFHNMAAKVPRPILIGLAWVMCPLLSQLEPGVWAALIGWVWVMCFLLPPMSEACLIQITWLESRFLQALLGSESGSPKEMRAILPGERKIHYRQQKLTVSTIHKHLIICVILPITTIIMIATNNWVFTIAGTGLIICIHLTLTPTPWGRCYHYPHS